MGALDGKVALITGASGGIGGAIARAFAAEGAALALHYSSSEKDARRTKERAAALGAQAVLLKADLTKDGAPSRLVAECVRKLGGLDILVNNAGAVLGQDHFLDLSARDWRRTFALNAEAPFFLSREAFKAMKRGGRIVSVSSVAAKFGGSSRSLHYGAAKAALEALTVGLAREGAARGILVNAIRAGVIDTPFHGKFKKDMSARAALIPLKRLGRPEDVARLALHLAGPGGDFITGQVLGVTGGE